MYLFDMRSFPEKTFEHWCSMHLSYRYKAKMHMWWPSSGADIDILTSPTAWGKRFWLELKTTEWRTFKTKAPYHELSIDLVQLSRYGKNQQGIPDYYVFPSPPWKGILAHDAIHKQWLGTAISAPNLAYKNQSGDKWFAEWTWVISGNDLRRALKKEIKKLPKNATKKNHVVAKVTGSNRQDIKWISPIPKINSLCTWGDFWRAMESCGSPKMPAQFLLPPGYILKRNPSRKDLVSALKRLAKNHTDEENSDNKAVQNDGHFEFVSYTNVGSDEYYEHQADPGSYAEIAQVQGSRSLVTMDFQALNV